MKVDGRNIAEVLEMTISEPWFPLPAMTTWCAACSRSWTSDSTIFVWGQPVPTLSGGEAQRLKLAGHLAEAEGRSIAMLPRRPQDHADPARSRTRVFLFDEPTTGLHFEDVAKLLKSFRKLLAAGHSLVVIEHNLDVIRASDWVIDLGPEGGDSGGEVVTAGTPQQVMKHATSHTGRALRDYEEALSPLAQKDRRSSTAEPRILIARPR